VKKNLGLEPPGNTRCQNPGCRIDPPWKLAGLAFVEGLLQLPVVAAKVGLVSAVFRICWIQMNLTPADDRERKFNCFLLFFIFQKKKKKKKKMAGWSRLLLTTLVIATISQLAVYNYHWVIGCGWRLKGGPS